MKVFMISDTHFGDERILRYENRPFSSVEEMDKAINRELEPGGGRRRYGISPGK